LSPPSLPIFTCLPFSGYDWIMDVWFPSFFMSLCGRPTFRGCYLVLSPLIKGADRSMPTTYFWPANTAPPRTLFTPFVLDHFCLRHFPLRRSSSLFRHYTPQKYRFPPFIVLVRVFLYCIPSSCGHSSCLPPLIEVPPNQDPPQSPTPALVLVPSTHFFFWFSLLLGQIEPPLHSADLKLSITLPQPYSLSFQTFACLLKSLPT